MIVIGKRPFEATIAKIAEEASARVESELREIKTATDLSKKVKELREQVATLEVEKSQKEEAYARKERELEHKVGLHKEQTKFEIESGKKEAVLNVQQENLNADKRRFEEQMKFHEDRFTEEVGYLKDMLGQMMQRLPTAEVITNLTNTPKRGR